ncbi:MAG: beta/gamma crystallin domain-containing protein [Terriglobales bacterium]
MKLKHSWLGFLLLLVTLLSTAGRVCAQDRGDHDRDDRDDRDRRSGACFYTEANFGGDKFCLRAGERVGQVPPGFNDRISSIRIFGRNEITVYQNRDFGEPSLRLRDDVANLQSYQINPGHSWNDRVSSIVVGRGRDGGWGHDGGGQYGGGNSGDWNRDGACFFKEADFRGEKFCVARGDRMEQVPSGFGDRISSVRLYGRVTVTVYQDANFGGPNLRLQQDASNLQSYQVKPGHSWNDRVSSIKVY